MVATWLGAGGGIVVFIGAIVGLLRGIFRQTAATDNNTEQLKQLTARIDNLFATQNGHEARIKSIEDWRRYGGNSTQSRRT